MRGILKLVVAVLAITPVYAHSEENPESVKFPEAYAHSGGNPEFVKFPDGYEETFTKYATTNRANQTQVARLYANKTAIDSYKETQNGAPGSIVVMEIYSTKMGEDEKPVVGDDGIFEIESLAAVAVMEKRDNWDDAYSADNRTGNWGFAVYNPDGTEKSNDLNCVQCHTPLSGQDYLFTYQKLVDFVKNH